MVSVCASHHRVAGRMKRRPWKCVWLLKKLLSSGMSCLCAVDMWEAIRTPASQKSAGGAAGRTWKELAKREKDQEG